MKACDALKKGISWWVIVSFLFSSLASAEPQNGQVVAGNAAVSQSGSQTTINQTSQNVVINWQNFNTASNEAVLFNQPNASSIALNRITSGLPTTFAGTLSANGQVWILNPAGVLFTATSKVDAAGLIATSHGISNSNFMSGHYQFDAVPGFENSKIINNGFITAKNAGMVGLVAPIVENNGVIVANLGQVHLRSGLGFILDLYGDDLIHFSANSSVQDGYVSNSGKITSTGGRVYLTAESAGHIVKNVISMSGVIEAHSAVSGEKGSVILHGGHQGTVKVTGNISTSSKEKAKGGFIETSGADLDIAEAIIDAGIGGEWLIDPYNITISSGSGLTNNGGPTGFTPTGNNSVIGANLIVNQLNAGTNVTISTGLTGSPGTQAGNITIGSTINASPSTPTTLTFIANGSITFSGTGTTITSGGSTPFNVVMNGASVALSRPINIGLGTLTLNTSGAITQTSTGAVTASTINATAGTGIGLSGATNTISNFNATNTASGAISLRNSGGLNITGVSQTGTSLTITNTGAITQSGSISVLGTTALTAGAANNIVLTNTNNAFSGALRIISGNNVSINNNLNLIFGSATSTISGNLNASTTFGSNRSITQTGALSVAGTSTFAVGSNAITLSNSGNAFTGAVSVSNTGVNNVSITNNIGLILGASTVGGNFSALTSNDAISQLGILAVNGSSSFTAGTNSINLSLNNLFAGAVAFSNSGANNVTIKNSLPLTFSTSSTGGTLSVTSNNNPINQIGVITVTGTSSFNAGNNSINLSTSNNAFTGAVTLLNSGSNNVSLANNIALSLAASTIGGNLVVTTTSDAITQTGPLTVSGTSSFNSFGSTITLNSANLFTGAVSLNNTGANAVSITNAINLILGASTIGGSLTASTSASNSAISQSGILTVTGVSSFSSGSNLINLSTSNNAFTGAVTLTSSNNVSINNNLNLVLAASTIGGNLTVTTVPASNRSITQTGALTVGGTSSFSAGGNVITLNSANLFTGAVSLNNTGANAVSITNAVNLILGTSTIGGSLTASTSASNRSISQSGALTVAGTSNFSSGSNTITLNANNAFTGAITLSNNGAANPVTLNNTLATSLPTTVVGGVLTITSGGNLTLTGSLTSGATSGQRSIILSALNLVNNVGAAVLVPGVGNNYVVYLSNVTGNTFNGLASGNQAIWNQTIGTLVPASVPSGNRYVFANQPSVTVTTTSTSKTYGTDITATVGTLYNVSAFVNAATFGNVFVQDTIANALINVAPTSLGAPAAATVSGSPYAVTSAATSTTGYAVVLNNTGTVTVNPKALTITADNQSKIYGSVFNFGGTEFTSNGLVNSDSISSVNLTSAGSPATATVAGSPYSIVASSATGSGLSNYTISYVNGLLTVNPKALTITADNQSKIYGSVFNFGGTEFTSNGLVNSDSISSVNLTSTGAPATATVLGSPYSIVASSATGSGLSNYTISYVNGLLTVNPKALTITADNQSKIYGSVFNFGGTEFTSNGLVNSDSISSVNLTSTGAPATATVLGSPYSIVASSATGSGLSNYTISYVNGLLTVNPKALTITADNQSKIYGSVFNFGGTEFTSNGLVNSDSISSVNLTSAGAPATATVAGSPYSIVASSATGSGLSNYTISYVNGLLTVNPKALTITADNQSKIYGSVFNFGGTEFTSNGLVNSDSISSVNLTSTGAPATATVTGSPYSIVASAATGSGLSNYIISYVNGLLTVNPKALTITADNQSKIYGSVFNFTGTEFTSNGLVNSDSISNVNLTSTGAPATATVLGSPYSIVASSATGSGLSNYTISYVNGLLTVNPKALTITADNQSKIYGSVFNFGGTEFTSNGLVNSDSISSVNLTSTGAPATATVLGSPYSIVASSATGSGLSNYTISYVNGLLTVNPKALTITADNQSKIYGSVFNFGGTEFTSNGLVNSDSISSVNLTSAGAAAIATVAGGPYSIVASAATGTGLSNYIISYVNGLLTVNQAPLSITASNQTKTYGQTLPSTTNHFTSSPLQNGETIGTVVISSAGLSPTAGVASSPYAITSVSNAAGGTFNASNYAITYIPAGSITVNPAALTITANNQVKLFGQTLPSTTTAFSSSGLQNGETIGTVDIVSAGLNGGAVLGSYPITSVSNAAGGTFNATNYNINYIPGALITVLEPIPSLPLSQLPNLLMLNYPDYYNHTFSSHADIIVIGRVLWLQGNVIVIGQDGSMRMLSLGDSVYLGDRVVAENTESQANIQVYTNDVVHVDANHPYAF